MDYLKINFKQIKGLTNGYNAAEAKVPFPELGVEQQLVVGMFSLEEAPSPDGEERGHFLSKKFEKVYIFAKNGLISEAIHWFSAIKIKIHLQLFLSVRIYNQTK
jgi:hypothetical protein